METQEVCLLIKQKKSEQSGLQKLGLITKIGSKNSDSDESEQHKKCPIKNLGYSYILGFYYERDSYLLSNQYLDLPVSWKS